MLDRLDDEIVGDEQAVVPVADQSVRSPALVGRREWRTGDMTIARLGEQRHTAATTAALAAAVRPKIVSERLGHATVSMTLDIYNHVVQGMQAEAAEEIGDLLFGR